MTYEEWMETVPSEIRNDVLWKVEVYRLAVLLGDLSWHDTSRLMRDKRTLNLSNQLYEAVGSISANIAEGYSRGTGKDRARFYEYSLGSARESRDWYYKARYILGEKVSKHRFSLLAQIIRLLLTIVPEQRGRTLHENKLLYRTNGNKELEDFLMNEKDLSRRLKNIPFSE
ncbi:MAG: four helix bundle protein [Chloroflexi bacterium]|nr:four helix bundle protein [Chloroflexota bacterium]